MKEAIFLRFFIQGLLVLLSPLKTTADRFFFNKTSLIQVSSAVVPLISGFDLTFRTCSGGVLLSQKGTNDGFFTLEVVPTIVNYSHTPTLFIPSHLRMTWDISGARQFVTVGTKLDQNFNYKVEFIAGSGAINSTLKLGISSADVPNSILRFHNSGPLRAGQPVTEGKGFVGCIGSGRNIQLRDRDSGSFVNIKNCTLDNQQGCSSKVCPAGLTGDYCEINIDDCAQLPCHHYSTCEDLIGNYSCVCGPRWTGRHCNIYLGTLCNSSVCQNGGICRDTADKNNYTCICSPGYTGRNCEVVFNPCDSSPCEQGGTCSKLGSDDFQCACPSGFKGKTCDINVNECAALIPCSHGSCIDGINNYTCNCTGSGYTGPTCADDVDECETNNPCHPNATCTNYPGTYQCNCQAGFTGKNCYEDIDDCHSNPCKNGGSCHDKVSGYICNCTAGFNGSLCESNIDDCVSHTCNDYSLCEDGVNNYTCVCKPGYTGVNCTTDVNECDSNPCQNGGNCTHGINFYNCSCPERYSGTNCEVDLVDDCTGNPCFNNATCVDDFNKFNCTCLPGYEGPRCENQTDECLSSPCLNNGTCIDQFNNFTCNCTAGFTGHRCDIDIDDCVINPCQNNATCVDGVNHRTCHCPAEFYGDECEKVRDACHPNPCENNSNCSFAGDSYNCSCVLGFEGRNCSVNIKDCKNDSCVANATCIDGVNNFTCQCPPGYRGEFCHLEIKECDSSPCKNNGTCVEGIDGYNCSCAVGFNGTHCELNIDDCPSHGCNNGTCIDGINSFTCSCTSGFSGEFCDSDINECDAKPCNCGTCVNFPGSYRCNCDQWTTGVHCEIDIDECQNQSLCSKQLKQGICNNHNAVTDFSCNHHERKGYECYCKVGFQGHDCEINTDDCAGSPCKNGATCTDGVFAYTCTCASGWTGKNCDIDINECELHVCENNATCQNLNGTYNCTCKPGFTDFNCSTDIDECESNPCVYGNCTDLVNDFNCTCFPGYTGKNCSEDIDECDSSPCINNGTCTDLIADYNCTCPSNYTGKRCETKITSCVPNPCLNNGSCTPHPQNNNYTCECPPGFGGALCENITTIGLSSSSVMTLQLSRNAFELSFQFRTTLSYGLLVADSNNTLLVFLDPENVTTVYNKATKLFAGKTANLSNGHWHTVHINISSGSVRVTVDNSSCGQHCVASSSLQTQVRITDLYIGGSPFAPSYDHNILDNFTGCIQDVTIDRRTVIPTDSEVSLVNTRIGCLRREVCASNPCVHGECVDKWIKYSCECERRWIGPQCNASLIPGTFGATEPLNVASSRRRRDIESMHNGSFAKFLANGTSFGASGELSFFVRTREHKGLVLFMTDNDGNHIAVVVHEGTLTVQVKLDGANSNVTVNKSINDGDWHFAEVQRNMLRLDNHIQEAILTGGKSVNLTFTFIGGLDDYTKFPDAFLIRTPFRGCLQDIRLNNKLFDFGFTSLSLISMEQYQLLDMGHLGEGCKGMNVCRSAPCGVGGYCKDLWNKYQCDCKPRYGGSDCALYGCSLVNLCPVNTTCRDVGENYECVHPVTLNGSSSSAVFKFTSNVNVTLDVSLRVRTRQPSTDLIIIHQDSSAFFEMEVTNGRVNVHYVLEGTSSLILSDVVVNDGQWHDVSFNVTSYQSYVTVDGTATYNSSRPPNREITGLLQRASVMVGNSVFKGCLDNVRIGGLLLPFVDYHNSTLNVSHVTPLKPHFNVNIGGIQLGCYSDDVCAMSPCVRGVCGDVWNLFTCACPEGWAGNVCNLTANMTCVHSPCVNGTCYNLTNLDVSTNESQVSDVGFDMFRCNCTPGFEGKRCENDTKECASRPCQNGGTCTELHLNYSCSCATGFTGRNCQIDIDDCAVNNCTNNSTCVDGIASYNCSCVDGFNGTFCELDIDECADPLRYGPCNATGTRSCNNTIGNFTCDCKQGYFGRFCQYDPSLTCEILAPCKHGANCSDNATAFSCSCPAGYNGTLCEFDIHECVDLPCKNNGTCIDSHANTSRPFFPGYKCQCTVDYTGNRCEKFIDLCDEHPCMNNATCERLAYDKYKCNCTPEYKGVNCTIFKPCHSAPCRNGATCYPTYFPVSNYSCTCALGFHGRNCENITNYCSPDPCRNNATCMNLNTQGKYLCNCTEGFGNMNCSGLLANCIPDPCVNGICIPLMDSYLCQCNPGYTGKNCNEHVNKCDSNPCQNGGTCTAQGNSFVCSCRSGWVGRQCEFGNPCVVNPCENGATCNVNDQFGNFSCVCAEEFTGQLCETQLTQGPPIAKESRVSPYLIGGVVVAGLVAILLVILLILVLRKRAGNGTYSPSKEEGQAGRVELDAMLKPPPQERLI